jgi:hypothetical protein
VAEIPKWRLKGDWFDVCRCDVVCPCTFAQPPTDNLCEGINAWHINEGNYGDVDLSDLSVVAALAFKGNIWAGEATDAYLGLYIDDRADDAQRQAIETIWSGQAGGWMAGFAQLGFQVRGIESATIDFNVEDDLSSWRVEIPGVLKGAAEPIAGPTTPEGARVQVHNPPGSEIGPGQIATLGVGADRVDGFGFKWEHKGKSSKHYPFDWGPD